MKVLEIHEHGQHARAAVESETGVIDATALLDTQVRAVEAMADGIVKAAASKVLPVESAKVIEIRKHAKYAYDVVEAENVHNAAVVALEKHRREVEARAAALVLEEERVLEEAKAAVMEAEAALEEHRLEVEAMEDGPQKDEELEELAKEEANLEELKLHAENEGADEEADGSQAPEKEEKVVEDV